MDDLPRLLIVSNNCLSKTNSNGRILSELLSDYPKERLAQFFIKDGTPDFSICDTYYYVTDQEVLNSLKGRDCGTILSHPKPEESGDTSPVPQKHPNKGAAARIARNWVWKFGRWNNRRLQTWIDDFDPECILLQSGDSVFMIKLAYRLARERCVPLVVFNSEDYYFKEENYFQRGFIPDVLYRCFIGNYRRHFNRLMDCAAHSVYMCDSLRELYDNRFRRPSSVIMSSTSLTARGEEAKPSGDKPVFAYLGNLGLKRYESLCEIGEALHSINSDYRLTVYGKTTDPTCLKAFEDCQGVDYRGFVDYDTVVSVMENADLLFHAESFDTDAVKNIRNAFSTKIADCLAVGVCFVYYGDGSIEGAKYLLRNDCACVITDKEKLKEKLALILQDEALRSRYIRNALDTVERNHRASRNREKMERIIYESTAG